MAQSGEKGQNPEEQQQRQKQRCQGGSKPDLTGQQQADADQRPERQQGATEKRIPQGGEGGRQGFAHHAHGAFRQGTTGDLLFQGKHDAHIKRDHEDVGIAVPAVTGKGAGPGRAFRIEPVESRSQHKGKADLLHASGGDGRVDAAGTRKAIEDNTSGKHGIPQLQCWSASGPFTIEIVAAMRKAFHRLTDFSVLPRSNFTVKLLWRTGSGRTIPCRSSRARRSEPGGPRHGPCRHVPAPRAAGFPLPRAACVPSLRAGR